MRRTTFDKILGWTGASLAVVLLAAGGLLLWGSAYIHNTVQGQLAAQQISFPPATAFAHAKAGKDARALEGARHAQPPPSRHRKRGDVASIDEDPAARRFAPPGNGVHQGRLAGAIGTDDPVKHAALFHLERYAIERPDAAVGDAQILNSQHVRPPVAPRRRARRASRRRRG